MVNLYSHQQEAIEKLTSGSILSAGVGTGKSITSLAYFYIKECGGALRSNGSLAPPKRPRDLYIITTARKRDNQEWLEECDRFGLHPDTKKSVAGIRVTIDSWNNLGKYEEASTDAFYIFDEQRLVGSGAWVKSFLKITKRNRWILLSATPGDTWSDYIPVFLANGFYKNRTEFLSLHAVYNRYSKFPKIDRYISTGRLEKLRRQITVLMEYKKHTVRHQITLKTDYDILLYNRVEKDRWDPFKEEPIRDIAQACYLMRKVVNSDPSRLEALKELMLKHERVIIFYSFDYELEILKTLASIRECAEWNGHKHQPVPKSESWVYLVQYAAGAEAWNCVDTDVIVFYSQNYSYKTMEQASGRIDRLNTKYSDLYYYHFRSEASIDQAILKALKCKQTFNENAFLKR